MPKRAVFFICLILLMPLCGCGRKTMVVPPDTTRPAAINDLIIEQNEDGISLRWSRPRRSQTGASLAEPVSIFEIERAESTINRFCPGCPLEFNRIATIRTDAHETPSWSDHDLAPGRVYTYRVTSRTGPFGRSLPSKPASRAWDELPPRPAPPVAVAGDQVVTLTWLRKADYGYELERATSDRVSIIHRVQAGRGENRFQDHEVVNGTTFRYRLRLVRDLSQGLNIRGPASEEVTATPHDMTPPPEVVGVRAVRTGSTITVFWEPLAAADLAGYRIYRKERNGEEMIGTTAASATSYIDRDPPANTDEWQYRVTAFDHADPPNESEPSMAAVIRRTR